MMTPRYPAGRIYFSGTHAIIKIRCNEYRISLPKLNRVAFGKKTESILDESGVRVGNASWFDYDRVQITIGHKPYMVDIETLGDVFAMRQHAAPLIESEPGQPVLGVV